MNYKYYALKLAVICVIAFVLQLIIPGFTELFLLDKTKYLEIWRFATAMFLHGGATHLLYNMFALILFGSIVEGVIGSRKFLILFFVTGIFANIISINFYSSSLGASGAIMGVIGALIIIRPMMTVWAFNMPMPMFVAGILWAAGDIIGAVGFLTGNPLNNTGNIAHLSGMGFGLIIGIFFRDWRLEKKQGRLEIPEHYARKWEDAYMR